MIALPIPHSSFSFFKTKSRPGYKWVSALHSKSGTNVGPKAWHLLSPSSSHGWGVEWIRIFYLVATVCVWSKTLQNQCKGPVTPVSFGTGLLWPGAPVRVHLRALRDKGWCQAVAPKDNTATLCCFQTDPLGKIYRIFALQGSSSSSLGVWTGLVNMWYRGHTEDGLSLKQGQMLQWVVGVQKLHTQQHSVQERHGKETFLKVVTWGQQIQAVADGHLALFDPIQDRTEHLFSDVQGMFLLKCRRQAQGRAKQELWGAWRAIALTVRCVSASTARALKYVFT